VTGNETQNKKIKRLQLDQTQVGLLLGFVSVGLVLAFGAGFITGMWYQTNAQIRPLELQPTAKTTTDNSDDQMTFYSTLTRSDASAAKPPKADRHDTPRPTPRRRPPLSEQHADSVPYTMGEQRFSVQVGSFRARDEAESLHTILSNKGYKTAIKTSLVPGQGILYRVRVGQFAERKAAKRIARRLASEERLDVMITEVAP
jgi:cell division septation protein DedD